jgi:hypothetical protein
MATVFEKTKKGITYLTVEFPYGTHDEFRNILDISDLDTLIKINYDFNSRILGNKSAGILLLEDARTNSKLVKALNFDFTLDKGIGLVKSHKGPPKTNLIISLPYYGLFEIVIKVFSGLNRLFLRMLVTCDSILSIKSPTEKRAKISELIKDKIIVEFKTVYPALYDTIHTEYFLSEKDFIFFIKCISNELARELITYPPNAFDSVPMNFWRGDILIGRAELFTNR